MHGLHPRRRRGGGVVEGRGGGRVRGGWGLLAFGGVVWGETAAGLGRELRIGGEQVVEPRLPLLVVVRPEGGGRGRGRRRGVGAQAGRDDALLEAFTGGKGVVPRGGGLGEVRAAAAGVGVGVAGGVGGVLVVLLGVVPGPVAKAPSGMHGCGARAWVSGSVGLVVCLLGRSCLGLWMVGRQAAAALTDDSAVEGWGEVVCVMGPGCASIKGCEGRLGGRCFLC